MVARVSVSKGGRRSLLYGVRRDNRDRVGRSVMPNGTPDVVIFPEAKPGAGVTNRSASPVSPLRSLCVVVVVYPLSQSIQAPPGFGFYVNSFMRRCPDNIHHRRISHTQPTYTFVLRVTHGRSGKSWKNHVFFFFIPKDYPKPQNEDLLSERAPLRWRGQTLQPKNR